MDKRAKTKFDAIPEEKMIVEYYLASAYIWEINTEEEVGTPDQIRDLVKKARIVLRYQPSS